jgi:hypothetical protein
MPRGSKPGTKRGGRKRGTPNRRTILADRIFVAAAAHHVAGWQELLSVLMDDQALPADTRLVIAQKSRSAAARSNKARAKTTNAKSAATSSQKQAAVELDSLFRLARNASLTEEERRKAAARMARVLLPATPTGDPSWSRAVADEYGFVISPKRRQIAVAEARGLQWIDQTGERSASRQGSGTPSGDTQKSRTSSSLEVRNV